jgi:Carboxypeptidase regulatory-like domain
MRGLIVAWLFFAASALACQCPPPPSVCQRVGATDIVFVGTVESIAPRFLDYWNPEQRQSLTLLNAETARAQADRSAASLAAARQAYAAIFPDLPEDSRKLLESATTHDALVKAFYRIIGNGRRVRFKVKTAYRGEEDEDETFDVWTPFGDCGVDFQTGETYLVYADDDEESNLVSTDSCSGTKRLTDSGADLPYLYFYGDEDGDSGHVDGFVTANPYHQLDPAHTLQPVAGVIVKLESERRSRFAETGADGKFAFDGLPAGDYSLSAYTAGYPRTVQLLAGPQRIRIQEKTCAAATLLISQPPAQK